MPIDAALLHQCASPSLKPALIETFITAVGAEPLTVAVRNGDRIVLVPPPSTPEEALALTRKYVGQAVVRVGVTQYPAGLGLSDPSELTADLFDACKNIRMGTELFGKVWRVVWRWYGNPTDESVMPPIIDDAIDAWTTGRFEGKAVFAEPDPGSPKGADPQVPASAANMEDAPTSLPKASEAPLDNPNTAAMRVDLSGIGGRRP